MPVITKRLEAAVRILVGDGPVKQRLGLAFSSHLDDLPIADLPDALRAGYAELHAAMHKAHSVGQEPSVRLTVQKMSFAEAAAHAQEILELYAAAMRDRDAERAEPLKIVHADDKPPRYQTGRP